MFGSYYVSPKKILSEESVRIPGDNLPEDLEQISKIFKIKVSPIDPPIRIRQLCCLAIVKECKKGKPENWAKIEQVKKYLSNLYNERGQLIIDVVRDENPMAGDRLAAMFVTVSGPTNVKHRMTVPESDLGHKKLQEMGWIGSPLVRASPAPSISSEHILADATPAAAPSVPTQIPSVIISEPSPAAAKAIKSKPLPPTPPSPKSKAAQPERDNLKADNVEQISRSSSPGSSTPSISLSPEPRERSTSLNSAQPKPPSPRTAVPSAENPLTILENAIETSSPGTEKKAMVQILKEMQAERAQETSPELLTVQAQLVQQNLAQGVETQSSIKAQLAAIEAKLAQKCELSEHERLVKEQQALQVKAAEIQAQVEILMNERDIKIQRREALKKFQADPNMLMCYRTVQIKLEELFISFKAVSGGLVPVADGDLAIYQTLLSLFGDVSAIIPIVGHAAKGILKIAAAVVGKVDKSRQVNAAHNASELLTISELKKFAENVARQFTENYAEQLQLLATPDQEKLFQNPLEIKADEAQRMITRKIHCPPAKLFAAYGIVWMVNELCQVHANEFTTSDLDRKLIASICQKKPPDTLQSFWQKVTTSLHLEGIIDKKGVSHHPECFYTKSGIKTEKGAYYSGPQQNPAVYAWRMGTLEDVKVLQLTPFTAPVSPPPVKRDGTKEKLLDQKVQTHDQQLERLEKTGHVVEGARIKALEQQLKSEREKHERLEREQKAQAAAIKAMHDQMALMAKALAEKQAVES